MTGTSNDFTVSTAAEPHRERTRLLLKTHPEVRSLIGRNQLTFAIIVGVVALQTSIAALLSDSPWWLALLLAYAIGAFADHCLFVLSHECAHNLIFKSRNANLLAGILTDLPITIQTSVSFRSYHLKHHSFQGDYGLDADLPSHWEARLIGSSFLGKAIWLLLFPVFQALRPLRLKEIPFSNSWTMINWIAVFGFDIAIVAMFGWVSLLYLVASFIFSIGLHPVGARWIQEHYLTFPPQETYSYYGPTNIVSLNVGYHNEHHDLPSVPWNKLPEIRRMAPEMYDSLISHRSYIQLLWRFLTDRNLSLYSRTVRSNRGEVPVEPEV